LPKPPNDEYRDKVYNYLVELWKENKGQPINPTYIQIAAGIGEPEVNSSKIGGAILKLKNRGDIKIIVKGKGRRPSVYTLPYVKL
jgi:hypothetical protein